MSIIDKVEALLPWRRDRQEQRDRQEPWRRDRYDLAPARFESLGFREPTGLAFRDDLDRWLQRLVDEPFGLAGLASFATTPHVEMRETDDEVAVTVEVPGVDRDHLDLAIRAEGLVVRGEAREDRKDERHDYRVVESRYGSFVRTVPLPPGLDLDSAKASLKDGVLTVRFTKADTRPGMRRIPVK